MHLFHPGHLLHEVRLAFRALWRRPLFATVTILSLALGIGATTAVFTVLDATLMRPLPYPQGERLGLMSQVIHGPKGEAELQFWNSRQAAGLAGLDAFEATAAFHAADLRLASDGQVRRVRAELVTPGYFALLGHPPRLGQAFSHGEGSGGEPQVLLADAFWREEMGSDPEVMGRTLVLDGVTCRIAGVLPAGFHGLSGGIDLWLPTLAARALLGPGWNDQRFWLQTVARLPRDISGTIPLPNLGGALLQAAPLPTAWQVDGLEVRIQALRDAHVDPRLRPPLHILGFTAAFVLAIACVNVANLLLTRGLERRSELAIRGALGAGAAGLTLQVMLEGLVIALLGGGLGLALAAAGIDALRTLAPHVAGGVWSPFSQALELMPLAIDRRVLAVAWISSVGCGLLCSVLPAWRARRVDLRGAMANRGAEQRTHLWPWRLAPAHLPVILQVVLAASLTLGAGLTLRSLDQLRRIDAGFEPSGGLSARIQLDGERYAKDAALADHLRRRLLALPGVRAATLGTSLPLADDPQRTLLAVEGIDRGPTDFDAARLVRYNVVSEGWLQTLGGRLLEGRDLTAADRAGRPLAVLINRSGAEALWPGQPALGRRVRLSVDWPRDQWAEVVGVFDDIRYGRLEEAPGTVFHLALGQVPRSDLHIVLKTAGDPAVLSPLLRQAVRQIDPQLALFPVRHLEDLSHAARAHGRFLAVLLAIFAAVALALSMSGIYAVMAQRVTGRRHELGIRAALGADAAALLRATLGEALGLTLAGAAIGLGLGRWLARWLEGQLYGLGSGDPASFAAAGTCLMLAALLAAYLPARRAARIHPASSLRAE